MENIGNVEFLNLVELVMVVKPEFQYGAKTFEEQQQKAEVVMKKKVLVRNEKSQ